MTFLNGIMLLGLTAVAIPIIIHLLNRRKAKVVEWGAMRFLEASLASRNRRIQLEELVLMALRCLLLAGLALALARPFVRSRALLPEGGQAQDLAIVLDGSLSMQLDVEGKSNFQRGLDEARQLVNACRPNDAVCLVLAGPTAQAPVPAPVSDRRTIHEALGALAPPAGSMNVPEALHAATLALMGGNNPAKRIVVITDGQRLGWDLPADGVPKAEGARLGAPARQRWTFLASLTAALQEPPTVIVRALEAPKQWRNASAAGLSFSRSIIGADRPVRITATVANTGKGELAPQGVELIVNGASVERRPVGLLAEGASGSVLFDHQFKLTGPHVVTARVLCDDDLPADNQTTRVVDVARTLPVLIIEGEQSPKALAGDADFLRLALAPPPETVSSTGVPPVPSEATGGTPVLPRNSAAPALIALTVVPAADAATIKKLSDYAVVILANVPRLPAALAKELGAFVAAGGGLLIAPGEKADKDFYNSWTTPDGGRLTGGRLTQVRADELPEGQKERFAHVAPNSIDHPALKLLSDPAGSDLSAARINRHWVLSPDRTEARQDSDVSVGACLDNGEPYLLGRKLGRGFVLTLALPLDKDFSDLPVHECYVPLVHELVYYLASPSVPPMNVEPGEQILYNIPGKVRPGDVGEMLAPDGRRWPVTLRQANPDRWQALYAQTAGPGLYRLLLPDEALGELAGSTGVPPVPPRATGGTPVLPEATGGTPVLPVATGLTPVLPRGVPFVVLSDPNESRLELLARDDYKRADQYVHTVQAETFSQVLAAISGGVPGVEIWQYLALALLGVLLAESLMTRLIAVRRKAHLAQPVIFGVAQVNAEAFRAGARRSLAGDRKTQEASAP